MPARLRPSVVTAGFAVLFAVIADLAWATAVATTSPWYDAAVSLQVYSVAILVASLLAVVLVLSASRRASVLDASLHRLDQRIALFRSGLVAEPLLVRDRSGPDAADIEGDPRRSADGGSRLAVPADKEGHDSLIEMPDVPPAPRGDRTKVALLRRLVRGRIALREARARVWTTVSGALAVSLVFLAVAAPMLPGSEGFAAAHYQLNTALILFLSYGLVPLVAWAVVSLGLLERPVRDPA